MNGVRRDHGISLEAVMKDNHLTERKTKVRIFKTLSISRRKTTENDTCGPTLEGQVGIKNPPTIFPEAFQKMIIFLIGCGVALWLAIGFLLARFCVDFGAKLGTKLGLSWHQNLKNEGSKMMSKK